MKLLLLSILFVSSFLLFVPFIGVESSQSPPPSWNGNFNSNITRGSSLSTSPEDTSYWLSPSGNIAFGFYKLPCNKQGSSSSTCSDRYVVGIWFVKSAQKTLVWTANRNNDPLSKQSSVLLTGQGKLVLQVTPENKKELLIPNLHEPISYAKMHDNGNFVLYGLNSQIIWESFDYPTDTILGGQKLRDGVDLVSKVSDVFNPGLGEYKLSIRRTDGLVGIYEFRVNTCPNVISNGFEGPILGPVSLYLDDTGNLFIVGSDDAVLRKLYENKNQQPTQQEQGISIYRATLDSKGDFSLFKERIDGNVSPTKKSSLLIPLWSSAPEKWPMIGYILYGLLCFVGISMAVMSCIMCLEKIIGKEIRLPKSCIIWLKKIIGKEIKLPESGVDDVFESKSNQTMAAITVL